MSDPGEVKGWVPAEHQDGKGQERCGWESTGTQVSATEGQQLWLFTQTLPLSLPKPRSLACAYYRFKGKEGVRGRTQWAAHSPCGRPWV